MKKFLSILCVLVLLICNKINVYATEDKEFKFDYMAGYRLDNLQWTIAGDMTGNNPNILSELKYKDLNIIQGEILITKKISDQIYLDGDLKLGFIVYGSNQDCDYLGDDRTQKFSQSDNDCNGNAVFDISGALGYILIPKTEKSRGFSLDGLFGYGFNCQNLLMTDGYQTLWIDPETGEKGKSGPIYGLNSTYKTYWQGFWVGLKIQKDIKNIKLLCGYEYHLIDYRAEGNWNLRSDFEHPKSFEHEAEGTGNVINAGIHWNIKNSYQFKVVYSLGEWETSSGIDKTYFSDGSIIKTQFNGANWDTNSIMISIRHIF